MTTAYPLSWPPGFPRYQKTRAPGAFKTSLAGALKNVQDSLRLFGSDSGKPVTNIVLSSNVTYKSHDIKGHEMTIMVGHHLTEELAELLVLLKNNTPLFISALRSGSGNGEVERAARIAYEHPEWGHKQSWERNPWAREAWTVCMKDVLAAVSVPNVACPDDGEEITEAHLALDKAGAPREWEGHEYTLAGRIAALSASKTGEGWKPIETAPKDGTRVLAVMSSGFKAVIWYDDQFAYEYNEETGESDYRGAWTDGTVASFAYEEIKELNPTHWMPLPAAPTAGEVEARDA